MLRSIPSVQETAIRSCIEFGVNPSIQRGYQHYTLVQQQNSMKILIADQFPKNAINQLVADGFEVVFNHELINDELARTIVNTASEVLVVRSTLVTATMLSATHLKLVIRAGSGTNNIDTKAAGLHGVCVSNCPGQNAIAVAELCFGLMLSIDRHIPNNVEELKKGRWNKALFSRSQGLYQRSIGLVGLGSVGKEMIPRAKAFGMSVLGWSRSLTPDKASQYEIRQAPTPIALAKASDIVSIHIALTQKTQNFIDDDFLHAMRPGSILINTSRPGVIDEEALIHAVQFHGIRAGLDVFDGQPESEVGMIEKKMFNIEGIIGTHHIGGSTNQAQQAVGQETVRMIREYAKTRPAHKSRFIR